MSHHPTERLRVGIIDEELPFPPNSGKRIRTLNLIERLAARHQITYVAHRNASVTETLEAEKYLHSRNIRVVIVERTVPPRSGPLFYFRLAANLMSPVPYSVQSHSSRQMQATIRQLDASGTVDLWQVEWTPYAANIRGVVRSPWLVVAHNIESQIWQRYSETERNPVRRWYIDRQCRKFQRFERAAFSEACHAVFVSDEDSRRARDQFGACRTSVVANGVDVDYFRPSSAERKPKSILFLGSLDWRPNQDAVQLLLHDVFPAVLAAQPDARLHIVGRNPAAWLVKAAATAPGVELHANVPDVRPYLWQCSVMAVPLRIGGGSRLKILEALACECPVASTYVGSEGLDLVPGEHFTEMRSDPSAMAAGLLQCIASPRRMAQTASEGRTRVLALYGWNGLADSLDQVWRSHARPPVGFSQTRAAMSAIPT